MAKRNCPFCQEPAEHTATACPHCTRKIPRVTWWKTSQALFFYMFVILAVLFLLQKCSEAWRNRSVTDTASLTIHATRKEN